MPAHAAENGGVRGTVPFDPVERYAVLRVDRGICGGVPDPVPETLTAIILSSHTATA